MNEQALWFMLGVAVIALVAVCIFSRMNRLDGR